MLTDEIRAILEKNGYELDSDAISRVETMLNSILQRPSHYGNNLIDYDLEHYLIIALVAIIYFYFRNRRR